MYIRSDVSAGLLFTGTPEVTLDGEHIFPGEHYSLAGRCWLTATNEAGFQEEDTMNRVWARDSAPVEKTLFWEDLNLDLTTLKN